MTIRAALVLGADGQPQQLQSGDSLGDVSYALAQSLSSAQQAQALANIGAAPLASPSLTGTPTAPNAAAGTNTAQLATTSFVAASFVTYSYASANYATAANATLTGTPTAPTPAAADNSTKLATTNYADRAVAAGFARTQVNDAAYAVLATDRTVAVTALTAARTLTLPAASAYPQGATLTVVDESGACSGTNTVTVQKSQAGGNTDAVNGAASAVLSTPFGYLALESNGSNKWTLVDQSTLGMAQQAPGAVAITGGTVAGLSSLKTAKNTLDDGSGNSSIAGKLTGSPLSSGGFQVAGPSSSLTQLFDDGNGHIESNKALWLNGNSSAAVNIATAGGAVSICSGSSTTTINGPAVLKGASTAPTPAAGDNSTKIATTNYADRAVAAGFARTQVADAAYTVLTTDRTVAVTALTAARTLTLPAASAYPQGATLTVVDESGACSGTVSVTVAAAGSDKVNGAAAAVLAGPYAYLALESNGSNKWTAIDASVGTAPLLTAALGAAGSLVQFGILEQLVSTASGTSVSSTVAIPNRAVVFAVSSFVTTAVAGPSSFSLGVSGNTGQFGSALGTQQGTQNVGVIGPTAFYAATPIVITAGGGTAFTGGAVRISIQYALFGPPTS